MLSQSAWKILEAFCTEALRNFLCYVHRTAQQLCLLFAPEPSGTSWAICTGTLRTGSAIRNPPEPDRSRPHQAPAPEPSGILSALYTGQLSNFVCYLHRNHPEFHGPSSPGPFWSPPASHQPSTPEPSRTSSAFCPEPSAPEASGTLSAICTGTLRNFINQLPRNCAEPHQPSAPEPSGTSSTICTGRLRNPPETFAEPGVAAAPDRTRAFLG